MVSLDSLMIILGHHYVTILLATMLIWALFSQSMCAFYFCTSLLCKSPYSSRVGENKDQKNFEYGHFLRSASVPFCPNRS